MTVALPELSAAKTVETVTQELELLGDREGGLHVELARSKMLKLIEGVSVVCE